MYHHGHMCTRQYMYSKCAMFLSLSHWAKVYKFLILPVLHTQLRNGQHTAPTERFSSVTEQNS